MIKRKTQNVERRTKGQEGIALYIAITITSALVLVAFAIISLALRQITISTAGRDSQAAFYAADSGTECALYWDVKNPAGTSAFSTSSPTLISCNGNASQSVGGGLYALATSTFNITFLPDPYCTTVTVFKGYHGGLPVTKIESRGYNTCDTTSPRRVERAIRVNY